MFLRTITIISCAGVASITAIQIFSPGVDHTQTISIIIGFLAPTVVGLLGLMKSQENAVAIKDMHASTDNTLNKINDAAIIAATKADEAAVKADAAATKTDKIAEVTTRTAQNVEAIQANGHSKT